jgi:HK97 family phage portal protein
MFRNGAVPPAVIEIPGEAESDEGMLKAKRVAQAWHDTHGGTSNAGKVGVLLGGAKLSSVAVTPEDAQWLDTRRFGVQEIARIFGVPPHLIADSSNSTSWGSGLAEQNLAFGQLSLRPWIERIEDAHGRLLTTHGLPDVFVKLNLDALLRAGTKDRYEAHKIGKDAGFLTDDEIRRMEDMPPLPSTIDPSQTEAVGALVRAGFDPAASLSALGLPPIPHTGRLPVTVQADTSAPGGAA